ncbi:MAG: hypothetical protein WCD18_03780, partial [Thermosynechococcaceae cyanobacterium]
MGDRQQPKNKSNTSISMTAMSIVAEDGNKTLNAGHFDSYNDEAANLGTASMTDSTIDHDQLSRFGLKSEGIWRKIEGENPIMEQLHETPPPSPPDARRRPNL